MLSKYLKSPKINYIILAVILQIIAAQTTSPKCYIANTHTIELVKAWLI